MREVMPVELLAAKGQAGLGSWVMSGQDQGCEGIPGGSLWSWPGSALSQFTR